jgi:CheY-like chemotaxis protein
MVILYVDDDPEDIEIFIEAVKEFDSSIQCLVAQDGMKAMDMLHADLLPDFIFLDINMPVISGGAVLSQIRKNHKLDDTPVVMYSTTISHTDIEEYRKMGATHFLIKHNHFQALCDAVAAILRPVKGQPTGK